MTSRPATTVGRRHTRGFTIVTNDIMNDERLTLEEMAFLCWVISRPHDWQVVPTYCRKRHKIGRDKFYKIVRHLCSLGYMTRESVRGGDGTIICIRYLVTDDPPVAAAAETDAVDEEGGADDPLPENTEVGISPLPDYPFPENQDTVINTDKIIIHPLPPQTEVGEPPKAAEPAKPKFEALRAKWPTENVLSAFASERSFIRLSEGNQRKAIDKAGAYLADMRAKKWRVCDLKAYIRERRWERLEATSEAPAVRIVGGTPQAYRWLEYHRAMGEPTGFTEERWRYGQPVYRPTEWPPAIVPKSTGPPSDHLTESDIEELAKG